MWALTEEDPRARPTALVLRATTGDPTQVECAWTTNRLGSDVLSVELKDPDDIAVHVCSWPILQ